MYLTQKTANCLVDFLVRPKCERLIQNILVAYVTDIKGHTYNGEPCPGYHRLFRSKTDPL